MNVGFTVFPRKHITKNKNNKKRSVHVIIMKHKQLLSYIIHFVCTISDIRTSVDSL